MQFPIAFAEGQNYGKSFTLLLPDEVQLCLKKYWKYTFNPHLIRPASLALLLCLRLSIKLLQNNYTTVGPRHLMLSLSTLP